MQPLGPQAIAQELNVPDYIDRLGASLGIDTDGLIKTQEQKMMEMQRSQQMQQDQLMDQTMSKVAERAVGNPEMIKSVQKYAEQQQQEGQT